MCFDKNDCPGESGSLLVVLHIEISGIGEVEPCKTCHESCDKNGDAGRRKRWYGGIYFDLLSFLLN